MADAGYRFQQPGAGGFFYYQQQHNQHNHHQRHIARNGSPNGSRATFTNDTPSPSRSPVSQTSSHNPYAMYGQTQSQSQGMMINGGAHQRYMPMGMNQKYQHQSHHQHHQPQGHHHHQQNHGGGHGAMGHQHTFSSGTMSNATPHFTPSSLHNGNSSNGQLQISENYPVHWQYQLQLLNESRQAHSNPHHHCRKDGVVRLNKLADPPTTEDTSEDNKEERNRVMTLKPARRQDWDALDCSGQGMKSIAPSLFNHFAFLKQLYLDHNRLPYLDPMIGQLRCLEHFDISSNMLMTVPEEIGMLVNLKTFLVYDNNLTELPREMGHLYKLEVLGIEGNPIDEELREHLAGNGTKALITHIRESTTVEDLTPPNGRDWLELDSSPAAETLSVVSYNILCEKYATTSLYGYTPSGALSWDYRKNLVLQEINENNADIVCLQEVDREGFDEFFRRELAVKDYKGVFWPKSRAKTMSEKEAKLVDGCATFFKGSKYHLLDKQLIDFANTAINRPDMKGEHDTFNRVMPRDHIAVVTFLENRVTGSRIIVTNAHIFWDPEFADVKLVQVAIMMEQLSKLAEKWAKMPACTDKSIFRHAEIDGNPESGSIEESPLEFGPSLEYASGPQIPLVICGDFNSAAGTGVYDLITNGNLPGNHSDLANRGYGTFTRDGMAHPFKLKSAYNGTDELSFTNYVPNFSGVIDYIWYSTNTLQVRGLLGNVDENYLRKVPGFPNHHFPSDHLALKAEFSVKAQKSTKAGDGESGVHRESEKRN